MNYTHEEQRERDRVSHLMERGAIFVFGSNLRGAHGMGAAREAYRKYQAEWGIGEGWTGKAYALPTKDQFIRTLPLSEIQKYVDRFLSFARINHGVIFAVTRIGCGLAGYDDEQIAPMFADAPSNCELPESWADLLANTYTANLTG